MFQVHWSNFIRNFESNCRLHVPHCFIIVYSGWRIWYWGWTSLPSSQQNQRNQECQQMNFALYQLFLSNPSFKLSHTRFNLFFLKLFLYYIITCYLQERQERVNVLVLTNNLLVIIIPKFGYFILLKWLYSFIRQV